MIIVVSYTKEEKAIIRKLMRSTKSAVLKRKYLAIYLRMEGKLYGEIAKIMAIDVGTVGGYIRAYNEHGIDGLVPIKPSGRPHFLTVEQEQKLYTTISENTPDEVGFDGIKNWTAKIACSWVDKEFGITYSVNGMLELFHRLKLSYTRPTYVLAQADPKKQERFVTEFENLKKNC